MKTTVRNGPEQTEIQTWYKYKELMSMGHIEEVREQASVDWFFTIRDVTTARYHTTHDAILRNIPRTPQGHLTCGPTNALTTRHLQIQLHI